MRLRRNDPPFGGVVAAARDLGIPNTHSFNGGKFQYLKNSEAKHSASVFRESPVPDHHVGEAIAASFDNVILTYANLNVRANKRLVKYTQNVNSSWALPSPTAVMPARDAFETKSTAVHVWRFDLIAPVSGREQPFINLVNERTDGDPWLLVSRFGGFWRHYAEASPDALAFAASCGGKSHLNLTERPSVSLSLTHSAIV
jgi:hypothetical protein